MLIVLAVAAGPARAGEDASGAPADTVQPADAPAQETIDAAVERGVRWLRGEQKRDGAFGQGPGETALALLTLRHCGVAADDRACERAARHLERNLPDGTVYGAALGAVALLEQDARLHEAKIAALVEDLVDAQCENGQWSYGYRRTARGAAGDNSNSQFAILALAAARARGIAVPDEPFDRLRTFLEETQNEDGGFGYSAKERSRSYASMTAGAAMCLGLSPARDTGPDRVEAPADDGDGETADPARRHALEWLARHFDPEANTGAARAFGSKAGRRSDAFWRHYWLWSVERAAAACGVERLGEHDWYAAGCRVLLDRQHDDGQWRDPEREILATCFALLFFRRSTERVITPRDRRSGPVTPSGPRGAGPEAGAADGQPDGE